MTFAYNIDNTINQLFPIKIPLDNRIGFDKMIKVSGLHKLPTKEYVIQRFELARGSFGLLCATGCSGKTMLVQYIACCVSSGTPLFGQFPVRKGSVVHIDQEQSEIQTQRRYERLAAGLGLASLDITRVTLANRFDSIKLPMEEVENALINLFTGKTLAIIDSLKKISETDENSAEIERVLHMLKRVAEKSQCAVLLIHHKGKGKDAKQSGRGHSSIYDSCDIQIDLDNKDGAYEMECAKNRDGDFFKGLTYELVDTGDFNVAQNCSEQLNLNLITAEVKSRKGDARGRILEMITNNPRINQGELFALVKGDRDIFNSMLDSLLSANLIEKAKGGRGAILYSLTTPK